MHDVDYRNHSPEVRWFLWDSALWLGPPEGHSDSVTAHMNDERKSKYCDGGADITAHAWLV